MELFANATPASTATGLFAAFILFATMLVFEARKLTAKPQQIESTLYTYSCGLLVVALIAGWLALKLSFSVCQPIPSTTIDSIVEQLDRSASEGAK